MEFNLQQNGSMLGLSMALLSTFFIGSSLVLKKKAHMNTSQKQKHSDDDNYKYMKEWIWWFGLSSMIMGELANFVAYQFAPASLVTPMGALSVLIASFLSSIWLDDKLDQLGYMGCLLCLSGTVSIINNAPNAMTITSIDSLMTRLSSPGFVAYFCLVLVYCTAMHRHLSGPRGSGGERPAVLYLSICGLLGSLSVMASKSVGVVLQDASGRHSVRERLGLALGCLATMVCCLLVQLNYLNRALARYCASLVVPVNYVCFTGSVLLASAILFQEWQQLGGGQVVGHLCGCLSSVCGVYLLNLGKTDKIKK